ncbi:hypothetical protein EJ08DRAFT_276740 [Tothia fuscella]|uniref:Uncharacterized protein n=1 Tax=Tothia fuscella TaxID=1048955 RepID=A0A9P4NQ49_9PEZI|nr:hypothetical protein EJ08DRAFT_276740 [Tothia fuscella]
MDREMALYGGMEPFYGRSEVEVFIGRNYGSEIIERRTLQAYLPRYKAYATPEYDDVIDFYRFIRRSRFVQEGQVERRRMANALRKITMSLARNTGRSEATTMDLLSVLEKTTRQEMMPWGPHMMFAKTFQWFASWAEFSSALGSERIASVLQQFFSKYARFIARQESMEALFEWATAILRSGMNESAMIICLREIVINCPRFVDELEEAVYTARTYDAKNVYRTITGIASKMDYSDFVPIERGRGLMRHGGRMGSVRRYTSASPLRRHARRPMMLGGRPMLAPRHHSHAGIGMPARAALAIQTADDRSRRNSRNMLMVNEDIAALDSVVQNLHVRLEQVDEKADAALRARHDNMGFKHPFNEFNGVLDEPWGRGW